jgi:hypothetical protein
MYKKIILMLLALSCAATTLKAQTEKGSQLLGGGLGVSQGKSTNEYGSGVGYNSYSYTNKTTSFSIGPNYSYFVAKNLDLGGSVGYTYQNSKFTDNVNQTNTPDNVKIQSLSVSVYLRKYFLYDNKIGIRTGPYATFQRNTTTNSLSTIPAGSYIPYYESQKGNSAGGGLALDFVYFPYKKLGLAASMGSLSYNHYDSSNDQDGYKTRSNSVNLSVFSGVNFSVFYAFGK